MPTPSQIRRRFNTIKRKLKANKDAKEHILVQWKSLQEECKHPNMYKTSSVGETGRYCPDCGQS